MYVTTHRNLIGLQGVHAPMQFTPVREETFATIKRVTKDRQKGKENGVPNL